MSDPAKQTNELKHIPLADIRENPVALRPVDKTSVEYLELVDSIRKHGVLNPISVREIPNPENNGKQLYSVGDGLHRYTAACDAGLDTIPAQVLTKDDAEILEAQIVANIHKIETKPAQYSKQLNRMMLGNPTLTLGDVASRLSRSTTWLNDRLGLIKLTPEIQKHVDEGRIKVSNAVMLAKLPPENQADFLDRAMTQTPAEFAPAVQAAVKAIRDAKRAGADPATIGFQHVVHIQKMSLIKDAMQSPDSLAKELIAREQPKTPVEIFQLALKWVLNSDSLSIQQQRERYEADQKAKEEAKAAAKEERRKKKEAENAANGVGVPA